MKTKCVVGQSDFEFISNELEIFAVEYKKSEFNSDLSNSKEKKNQSNIKYETESLLTKQAK